MNFGHLTLWQIELLPWYAFLIAWGIGLLWVKPVKAAEPIAARLLTGIVALAAFVLLFNQSWPLGVLRRQIWPVTPTQQWIGIALTYAGMVLAIWARIILGANWSARVTLKVGHELIRSGPYAYVRHPIYSGLLLAMIGTALVIGEWRGLLPILLVAVAHHLKARREEQLLTQEFGDQYLEYRRNTGGLVPRFR